MNIVGLVMTNGDSAQRLGNADKLVVCAWGNNGSSPPAGKRASPETASPRGVGNNQGARARRRTLISATLTKENQPQSSQVRSYPEGG